jgi:hypothetical protein
VALDDLVDRQPGGVDLDGVIGRLQRRVLAALVLGVAQGLVAQDGLHVGAQLLGPAASPFLGAGGEVDLQLGVGRHHGPDVAALGHPVAGGHQLALLVHQGGAHAGVLSDARGLLAHLGRPQPLRVGEVRAQLAGTLGGHAALAKQRERRRAVHGAGVEIGEPQCVGRGPRHGALARPGGAVDGHDHPVRLPGAIRRM